MADAPAPRHLVSTGQVAETLRCSRHAVNRLVEEGRLPVAVRATGPKGVVLFDPDEVERLRGELAAEHEAKAAELRGEPAAS